MSLWESITSLFKRSEAESDEAQQEEAVRQAFKKRCKRFKALLSANKRALEAMANLEEAMRGERFFNMNFIRGSCTLVIANVYQMVRHMEALANNPEHQKIFDRIKEIQFELKDILSPQTEHSEGPLVLPLEKTGFTYVDEVGGKMASLGEASQQLGLHIPAGFVVTASGFRRFLEANNLQEEINQRIQMVDLSKLDAIFALSSSLQKLICSAEIPIDLEEAILMQYDRIAKTHGQVRLAVRSSAIGEDGLGTSFAGQYHSELNVARENLLTVYKEVVASKYGVTAMTYRFNRGIPDDEVPMCVGCLVMIDAAAGGVAYSMNPLQNEFDIIINAVPGLPKSVVDGSAELDIFHVSREQPHTILMREISQKVSKLVCAQKEGITLRYLSEEEGRRPSLTDAQVVEIGEMAMHVEEFYGTPQDIEWVYTHDGSLVVLQSRALPGTHSVAECSTPLEGIPLISEGGVCASSGVGAGSVFMVRRDADMMRFPAGAVLLVEQAHSRWAPLLARAAAVVSEYGGVAGHLASVAREYGIPAIFGLAHAMRKLEDQGEVTVDAYTRRVYSGRVDELLEKQPQTQKIFVNSPVYAALMRCVDYIVPLNLLDPESPDFTPANCKTLHDMTRYCHEIAVKEMFQLDESLFFGRCGKQLRYNGSKLQYFVIDLGDGFCSATDDKYIDLENICCRPMRAIWDGMIAIPWTGPPRASARGLMSVIAESASNPELEITSASVRMMRNYFMINKDYCNLQASFGYHFCTVEVQAGPIDQENYVSFHFKGGAANLERRSLRVKVIAEILIENGFIVDVKEDALSARAEDLSEQDALDLLHIIGYLLIHTRQVDAALGGDVGASQFADVLRKGVAQTLQVCSQ